AGTVAKRIGSPQVPMTRTLPDGRQLHWEVLGVDGALTRGLPFFITWSLGDAHPARMRVTHPSGAHGIAWVEQGGDPSAVREWVGPGYEQLRLVGGAPGPHRLAVETRAGELIIT